jgi:hypothetical protein
MNRNDIIEKIITAKGSVTMAGVLAQRQSGLGWGQIANNMGVKLGSVVSASKTDKAAKAGSHAEKSSSVQNPARTPTPQAAIRRAAAKVEMRVVVATVEALMRG